MHIRVFDQSKDFRSDIEKLYESQGQLYEMLRDTKGVDLKLLMDTIGKEIQLMSDETAQIEAEIKGDFLQDRQMFKNISISDFNQIVQLRVN